MVLTLHTEKDTHIVNPGLYTHEYIRQIQSSNFDNNIIKVSLQRNSIALLSSGSAPSGYGDTHVIVGPTEYTIPSGFTLRSFRVDRYRDSDWGTGAQVTAYQNQHQTGMFKTLLLGEYDSARLAQKEDGKLGVDRVQSLGIADGTLVVLYSADKSLYLVGPRNINDLNSYIENVTRIVVYSIDKPPAGLKDNPVGHQDPIRGDGNSAYDNHWADASKQHRKRKLVFGGDGDLHVVQKYDKKNAPNNVQHVVNKHKKASDNEHAALVSKNLSHESEFGYNYARLFVIIILVIIAIYSATFTSLQFMILTGSSPGGVSLAEDF